MSDEDELIFEAELSADVLLSAAETGRWAGLSPELVLHYHAHGLIEAAMRGGEPLFGLQSISRLRKIQRLRAQLGINLQGIAIVLDLLDRLEELRRELQLRQRFER